MTAPLTSWRVLRDHAPFGFPRPGDVLGVVEAPDRGAARIRARELYPTEAVVVVRAECWPTEPSGCVRGCP